MIRRLLGTVRAVERVLAVTLLAAMVAVVFAGTTGRYLGHPVVWSDEVAQGLFVWVALLAADITLQRNGHFSVDELVNFLPPKARFALDIGIHLLLAALLALLLYYAFKFASMTGPRPMPMLGPMLGLRTGIVTTALPVGFALMFITVIEQTIDRLAARRPPEPTPPSEVM